MNLEINSNCKDAEPLKIDNTTILITPPIDENYWLFRVAVSEK